MVSPTGPGKQLPSKHSQQRVPHLLLHVFQQHHVARLRRRKLALARERVGRPAQRGRHQAAGVVQAEQQHALAQHTPAASHNQARALRCTTVHVRHGALQQQDKHPGTRASAPQQRRVVARGHCSNSAGGQQLHLLKRHRQLDLRAKEGAQRCSAAPLSVMRGRPALLPGQCLAVLASQRTLEHKSQTPRTATL